MDTIETLAAKMDQLGLWDRVLPFNWAVKQKGTAVPYFCSVIKGEVPLVKVRFLMLAGWQTLNEYVLSRADPQIGFYSSPMEIPHYELVIAITGEARLFRYETGYMPVEANEKQRAFIQPILWQSYGLMLRMENDERLPLKYAEERAIFARVEKGNDVWEDEPLMIPDARPIVEKISLSKDLVGKVKDLPFLKEVSYNFDFLLDPKLMTAEKRPRTVYRLWARDNSTDETVIDTRISLPSEATLKSLWEEMPAEVLKNFLRLGKVPGELRVQSGRVFRFLRPLCLELPLKLSLHDSFSTEESK